LVRDKLTLSIEREVIKEAKNQELNISDITEKILKVYTLVGRMNGSIDDAYQRFFESIIPLLKESDCSLKIAESGEKVPTIDDKGNEYEVERPLSIQLTPDGSFYIEEHDKYFKNIGKIPQQDFLEPGTILSNLVIILARTAEVKTERMSEILMAKNIVDAISKTLATKHSTRRENEDIRDLKLTAETPTVEYRGKKYRRVKPEKRHQEQKKH